MTGFGDYTLVEQIREGAHGVLHLAVPPARLAHPESFVALKRLRAHPDADDFRRIANELRLLHAAQSSHVVELLDAGTVDGELFLVTPHYADGTLAERCSGWPVRENCRAVANAARGVHALHELGVAHRNIRPENVIIDGTGARIGDLDLAQLVGGASTVTGGPLGSLEYTAPELLLGEPASRQTDIWSLAMTLHHSLTGHSALGEFPTTGLLDACRHVIRTTPVVDGSLPLSLRSLLSACLSTDPSARPPTALHMSQLLDDLPGAL